MKISTDERGMTLVELLIVTILGALVLGAIYQVLITNQRTFAAQSSHVQGQQTLRGGMDILFGELREISAEDGDIISMSSQELHVRVGRSVGVVCSFLTGGNNPTAQVKKVGRFLRGDSARVFYENNPSLMGDDDWRTAFVSIIDTTGVLTCPDGEPGQQVRLRGIRFGSPPDSIHAGALIRNFHHYDYGLGDYNGRAYLLRYDHADAAATPLVGPLDRSAGVTFTYYDASGNVTTVPADVRQIEVTLRTTSDFVDAGGSEYRDSLTTRIFTRNSSN